MVAVFGWVVLAMSLALLTQALFSLYLMLYTWWRPDRLEASRSPSTFAEPSLSFTVLLPARHEQDVIYETIQRVLTANYPARLIQALVICEAGDRATIAEARRAFERVDSRRVAVITFDDGPINKPHGLNVGLRAATGDVVTVFDAEDDLHPDIFNVVNTLMRAESARVVQSGVQLMNFRDQWFSALNVMEYYFWFRSRLHFHAGVGMIPLGGNTVFVERALLNQVGGWDERCLTEDADLGVRLSALGERIRVVYDPLHVTKEETPDSLSSFIRQRTRWNQGFLQVLRKGDWLRLPRLSQRLLALYTLAYPLLQAAMFLIWPVALVSVLALKLPLVVTLPSLSPLYLILFQLLLNVVGLWEFTRLYRLRFPLLAPVQVALAFIPFNLALAIGAVRAVYRELLGRSNWEKTQHVGAHRAPAPARATAAGVAVPADRLLLQAVGHFEPDRASVLTRETQAEAFTIAASWRLPSDVVQSTRVRVGEGIAGWAAATGRSLLITPHSCPAELRDHLRLPELCSALVVPIERDGQVRAVVTVGRRDREFLPEDLRWLERQAAAALDRAERAVERDIEAMEVGAHD